jgi:hypothetical protein
MTDIVDRLRDRAYSLKAKDPLCEEAAAYIVALRMALGEMLDGKRNPDLGKALKEWEATSPKPYAKSITKDDISNTDGRIWLSTHHPPD